MKDQGSNIHPDSKAQRTSSPSLMGQCHIQNPIAQQPGEANIQKGFRIASLFPYTVKENKAGNKPLSKGLSAGT
jgi:hypothetical protein